MITVKGSVYSDNDYRFLKEAFAAGIEVQTSACDKRKCNSCEVKKACHELEAALGFVAKKSLET